MSLLLKSILAALVASQGAFAIGTPFGYAAGTTGGGNAAAAVPSSTAQLVSWLGDNTPRVILLDKTYDFTDLEGSETGKVCKPWTCSPGAQVAIDVNGWCGREQKNAKTDTATWKKAGLTAIKVGSNKTLLGKGTAGWIKGKGLRIAGSSNIIIQNVRFSDINAAFVWGGDALTIDGGKQIWIDHNYFKNVGRQFIVTGYGAAQGVTISDNVFDGSGDTQRLLSVVLAAMDTTTGRSTSLVLRIPSPLLVTIFIRLLVVVPGLALTQDAEVVHMYNNYFVDITDHALDADTGSHVLLEGNYFNRVLQPSLSGRSGIVFGPTSSAMNAQCKATLGRDCASNTLLGSGQLAGAANGNAIGYFNNNAVKGASVMDPSKVGAYVQNNAGTGKIN
ncbi:Pectate lyase [Rhizoctonia solani]|uniref:pectin lyase n=1 Tax=Rhizoctonia solani TaxID=456999 RepID=A0A8H7H3D2_9AGAM|nr:Pectate lyase [Rhizoctonia solani]